MANTDDTRRLSSIEKRLEIARRELKNKKDIFEVERNTSNAANVRKEILEAINEVHRLEEEILKRNLSLWNRANTSIKKFDASIGSVNATSVSLSGTFNSIWRTIMDVDKSIKKTNLSLGFTGTRSRLVKKSFKETAGYAMRLGGSAEDLQTATTIFAEETGRARVLSAETLRNVMDLAKGTSLGVESAAKLYSNYHLIGVDSRSAAQHISGIMETSERMGVSASNVLDNVNKNFRRLRTFTFIQGVKGFAEMASYAEKMRIDISQALDSAEAARHLDKAIEMAAQLQVMGGEFAKTDPFELLFLARNDPAGYTKKINEMTGSVVSFRKMADGTFEHFISPADRDRLTRAAKVLNMQTDELIEQSRRYSEIQHIRSQMVGMGLSDADKEIVEGLTKFDSNIGRFVVKIGGVSHRIENLTRDQIKSFAVQGKSLEARAIEAQTFDEAFRVTINELKSTLLPILNGVNDLLRNMRPTIIKITEWIGKFFSGGSSFLGAMGKMLITFKALSMGFSLISRTLVGGVSRLIGGGLGGGALGGGLRDVIGRHGKPINAPALKAFQQGQIHRKGELAKISAIRGAGMMKGGVGIGAGALGVGAGVGAGAFGIAKLAESMKGITPGEIQGLTTALYGFVAASLALGLAGKVGGLGAAAIGASIGVAAAGIGYMARGLGEMIERASEGEGSLLKIASGITAMSGAMLLWTATGGGLLGMVTLNRVLSSIAKRSNDLNMVGSAFEKINAVLTGNADDFERIDKMIQSIANVEIKDKSAFSELAKILKSPIQVQFSDREVSLVSNITLKLDGKTIAENIGLHIPAAIERHRTGK